MNLSFIDKYYDYLIVILIAVISLFTGYLIGKLLSAALRRIAIRKNWNYGLLAIGQLKGSTGIIFLLLALYFSERIYNLDNRVIIFLDKTSFFIIILSVTVFLSRILTGVIKTYYGKQDAKNQAASIFINISKLVVYIIGFLIILNSLGITITPVLTALGIGGLAVSLALQDTLSNLFAGINLLSSHKIKVGDRIKLHEGYEGIVEDISWRYTTLIVPPNNALIVPNSKLAATIITNYFLPNEEVTIFINLGVSYNSDLDKVEKVTLDVAREVLDELEKELIEFQPVIRLRNLENLPLIL